MTEMTTPESRTEGASRREPPEGRIIHVLVEVETQKPPVRLEFDTPEVTGRTIKNRAGIPLDNDLARRQGQKLELVTNDGGITIENGDRFVSLPPGTIS